MTTEINVTVGPQSLKDRNRQETAANRWRRAEQDAQQRTETAAKDARRQLLAQQGLTGDGQRYGDPRQARFRRQKPAAFRFGGGSICHFWWLEDVVSYDYSAGAQLFGSIVSGIASGNGEVVQKIEYGTPATTGLPGLLNVEQTAFTYEYDYSFEITRFTTDNGEGYYLTDYLDCYPSTPLNPNDLQTKTISYSLTNSVLRTLNISGFSFNAGSRLLVLPAGEGCCIVVVMYQFSWYTICSYDNHVDTSFGSISKDKGKGSIAYVCSNTAARQIVIPLKLQQILDIIHPDHEDVFSSLSYIRKDYRPLTTPPDSGCPPGTYGQTDLRLIWDAGTQSPLGGSWKPGAVNTYTYDEIPSSFPYSYYSQVGYPDYEPEKYEGVQASNPVTPSIFETLNEAKQFIDPSLIKSFPESKAWVVEIDDSAPLSYSYGAYSLPGVDPSEDESGSTSLIAKYNFSISDNLDDDFPDPKGESFYASFYTVWDWDDPEYCRRMCFALGFSLSDLRP